MQLSRDAKHNDRQKTYLLIQKKPLQATEAALFGLN